MLQKHTTTINLETVASNNVDSTTAIQYKNYSAVLICHTLY